MILDGWGAWSTWHVIMQMANHTTHHLGQVLTLARQAGYEPTQDDWTDLILYYLQRFPTQQPDPETPKIVPMTRRNSFAALSVMVSGPCRMRCDTQEERS